MSLKVLVFKPKLGDDSPLEAFKKAYDKATDLISDIVDGGPVLVSPDGEAITIMFPPTDEGKQMRYCSMSPEEFKLVIDKGLLLLGYTVGGEPEPAASVPDINADLMANVLLDETLSVH